MTKPVILVSCFLFFKIFKIFLEDTIFPVSLSKITKYPFSVTKKIFLPSTIGASTELTSFCQILSPLFISLVSLASDKKSFNKNLDNMITNKAMRKEQGENAFRLFNDEFTVRVAALQIYNHFL